MISCLDNICVEVSTLTRNLGGLCETLDDEKHAYQNDEGSKHSATINMCMTLFKKHGQYCLAGSGETSNHVDVAGTTGVSAPEVDHQFTRIYTKTPTTPAGVARGYCNWTGSLHLSRQGYCIVSSLVGSGGYCRWWWWFSLRNDHLTWITMGPGPLYCIPILFLWL